MAEKKPSGFVIFLLEMALPMILQYGKLAAVNALQTAADTNPKAKEMIRLAIVSIYPVIDTVLEDAAFRSKTKVDDKVVTDLKGLCEDLAAANTWELQNLDGD